MKECYICHRRFYTPGMMRENENGQVECPVCNMWIYLDRCKDIKIEDVLV